MDCPNCKKTIESDSNYCEHCGISLLENEKESKCSLQSEKTSRVFLFLLFLPIFFNVLDFMSGYFRAHFPVLRFSISNITVLVNYSVPLLMFTIMLTFVLWIYQIHKDLKTVSNDYPISPMGAVVRAIIPVYSIYGIWEIFKNFSLKLKEKSDYFNSATKKFHNITICFCFLYASLYVVTIMLKNGPYKDYTTQDFAIKGVAFHGMDTIWVFFYGLIPLVMVVLLIQIVLIVFNSLAEIRNQKIIKLDSSKIAFNYFLVPSVLCVILAFSFLGTRAKYLEEASSIYYEGVKLYKEGRSEESIEKFYMALGKLSNYDKEQKRDIYHMLTQVYSSTNQMKKAKDALIQTIELEDPGSANYYARKGILEIVEGNIVAAFEYCKQSLELDENNLIANRNIGMIYSGYYSFKDYTDYDKALIHTHKAYLADVNDVNTTRELARLYLVKKMNKEAILILKTLDNDTDPNLKMVIAGCFLDLHQKEEAFKYYQEAVALNPELAKK